MILYILCTVFYQVESTHMSTVLQVISRKDQEQYWDQSGQTYNFFSIDMFSRKFKESPIGKNLNNKISVPFDKSRSNKDAITFSVYSLPKWSLFKACLSREFLLMKRNAFIYAFKSIQVNNPNSFLGSTYLFMYHFH